MSLRVYDGQTFFDVALMVAGSAEAAFDLALENGLSITDDLTAENELQFTGIAINKKVVEYYRVNSVVPATDKLYEWILLNGFWDDLGVWQNAAVWLAEKWLLAGGVWNDNGVWWDREFWN